MGVAKVILNGDTLMDVTQKTVTANTMLSGTTALAADGEGVVGSIGIYNGDVEPASIIPAEYQRVNYIQSSGSEYIDTGIYGDQTTSLEMTMQRLTALDQGAIRMFGSRTGVASNGFFISTLNNGKVYIDMGASASGTQTTAQCMWTLDKVKIFFDDNGYSYGGTDYTWATDHHGQSFVTPNTLTIFNARSGGSFGSGMSAKLYSVIIKKNGEEVFNGVPCYRLADDVAGLYDTVSQSFFVNASESGEFVVGDDVHVRSKWPRPADWPDYDKIDISEEECMFFTYDSGVYSDLEGLSFAGLYAECTGGYTVERGFLNNGVWTVEKSTEMSSGGEYCDTLPTDRKYTVYKVKPTVNGNHITNMSMDNGAGLIGGRSRRNELVDTQYCIERYGNLPYVTRYGKGYAYRKWALRHIVSDTLLSTASLNNVADMYNSCPSLEHVDITWETTSLTSLAGMFRGCPRLRSINVSSLDTSHVTSMYAVFYGCYSLYNIDVSDWDTSSVTTMQSMFYGCPIKYVDVSKWDTSSVTTMRDMFMNTNLNSIDVSGWDVSSVTDMQSMFQGTKIRTIDVSNWDTQSLTSMSAMFRNASSLTSLDVSQWNTENLTNLWYAFNSCSSLVELDLSQWDTSHVTQFNSTFAGCNALLSLGDTVIDMTAATVTSNTFDGCMMLRGFSVKNVPDIQGAMFNNMTYLDDFIIVGNTLPTLTNTNAFNGNRFTEGQRIRVNASLVEEAKAATNWSTYADYIEAIE